MLSKVTKNLIEHETVNSLSDIEIKRYTKCLKEE